MAIFGRTLPLLLWKNLTVRKRHWIVLLLQFLVPLIFQPFPSSGMKKHYYKNYAQSTENPNVVSRISHHPILTKDDLLRFPRILKLYYSPRNYFSEDLMERTRTCLSSTRKPDLRGFGSEEEVMREYYAPEKNLPYQTFSSSFNGGWSGRNVIVIFKNPEKLNSNSKQLQYTIRDQEGFGISSSKESFLPIQMCLDESFIKMKAPNSHFKTHITIQEMPSEKYSRSNINPIIIDMMLTVERYPQEILAVIAFLIPLFIEISYPANEKALGVNILMSMNGVKNHQNLLSWLISGCLISTIYIVPRLISLFYFNPYGKPPIHCGNGFLIMLVHFVHIAHLLAFGYHVSSYFPRSFFRTLAIFILYLGSIGLFFLPWLGKWLTTFLGMLFPNILFIRMFDEILIHEDLYGGIRWWNLFQVANPNYNFTGSLGVMLILSMLGTLLHFFLALYASALFPGKYGVSEHPFYFLKYFKSEEVSSGVEYLDADDKLRGKPFERVPENVYIPGIRIRNLRKSYNMSCFSREKKHALRGISIDFYEGQITTLLGHNGAGKTTMMSILTGMLSQTEGTVLIGGKDIKDEMDQIKNNLGLCPQEDILFPDLSVFEQLQFFALLKNKNKTEGRVNSNVMNLMQTLKIAEKRNEMPDKLSGGQKRRVCLGIAMVGDSSILILDEPTSGMDPETSRAIWDMLLEMRGRKTILISTHNMEEADVLGDRTAIIELGRLKCYGSSMFLKKFYGEGNMEVTLSTEDGCDVENIKSQLTGKSQLLNSNGRKIVLSVPYSDQLPADLDRIEERKEELGVTGMSVSLITLEQVFLRSMKENDEKVEVNKPIIKKSKKVDGGEHIFQSMMALFQKRFKYMWRNKLASLFMILLPLLIISRILSMTIHSNNDDEKLLSLEMYSDRQVLFSSNKWIFAERYQKFVESFSVEVTNVGNDNISKAIHEFEMRNQFNYHENLVAAASFAIDDSKMEVNANALFSEVEYSAAISLNLVTNAILKALTDEEYRIDASSQNIPRRYVIEDPLVDIVFRVLGFVIFLLPTIALYAFHPLVESSSGMKDLQRMTGVTGYLYWISFFLFDVSVFIISMILMFVGIFSMGISRDLQFFHGTETCIMVFLLICFAVNTLPFIYIFSFWGKTKNTIFAFLTLFPLLSIALEYIPWLVNVILKKKPSESLKTILSILRGISMLVPYKSFFSAQVSFLRTVNLNTQCRRIPKYVPGPVCSFEDELCCKFDPTEGMWRNSFGYFKYGFEENLNISLKESITYLCLAPFIYILILGLLEYKVIPKIFRRLVKGKVFIDSAVTDYQVKKEKITVASEIRELNKPGHLFEIRKEESNTYGGYPVSDVDLGNRSIYLAYELCKYYGKLPVVKGISFSVKKSECFGLLGVNGAGKSTTFRLLTGEEFADNGLMYLNGQEISVDRIKYLSQMGYCPQNHALIDAMTAEDHLELFASLRGVPEDQVSSEVDEWINRLNLNRYAKQPSGTYSGGNKRRLSIAIALIGNPEMLLLDEPTTGVDPGARRSLWNVIKSCQLEGQSIILTSHSMEECEALCNRLVIMVDGRFVCIGPSEQLKQRFGAGFDINIRLNPERTDFEVAHIKMFMNDALQCELRDEHVGYLTYHVTNSRTKWKTMYDVMECLKGQYNCVQDFSVSTSTLEQLFLQFARASDKKVPVQV